MDTKRILVLLILLAGLFTQVPVAGSTRQSEEEMRKQDPKVYLKMLTGNTFELLNKVVECESAWNPSAKSPTGDIGLFQINRVSWGNVVASRGISLEDPKQNIEFGVELYQKYGTSPWNNSKHCWKKRNDV